MIVTINVVCIIILFPICCSTRLFDAIVLTLIEIPYWNMESKRLALKIHTYNIKSVTTSPLPPNAYANECFRAPASLTIHHQTFKAKRTNEKVLWKAFNVNTLCWMEFPLKNSQCLQCVSLFLSLYHSRFLSMYTYMLSGMNWRR